MKKVIFGLFLAGTMVSFNNLNAKTLNTESLLDNCCTVEGAGVSVTDCNPGNSCGRARAAWFLLVSAADPGN
ncbi:hypothetical protein [Aquimarina sp. AU474]|uniref:hypothetical protein n=1 Tax=Aquimarina sp. AU474 TaxID=2108529 RepID=UPI000D699E92|nr:hypothetical protein [Aquimarina sp. AU474]